MQYLITEQNHDIKNKNFLFYLKILNFYGKLRSKYLPKIQQEYIGFNIVSAFLQK